MRTRDLSGASSLADFDLEESIEETRPYLLVLHSSDPRFLGRLFDFTHGGMSFGSDENHDIALQTVSVNHAQVTKEGREIVVYDLGSVEGTYLNGTRIQKGFLEPGDLVGIGHDMILKYVQLTPAQAIFQKAFAQNGLRGHRFS